MEDGWFCYFAEPGPGGPGFWWFSAWKIQRLASVGKEEERAGELYLGVSPGGVLSQVLEGAASKVGTYPPGYFPGNDSPR